MIEAVNTTTFKSTGLGDVQSVTTIGGSDVSKFVPNINISFHGNEFFINLNRRDKVVVSEIATLADGTISQKIVDETDEYYEKDGRFKWDIRFDSRPANMQIDFEMVSGGDLEFYRQPDSPEKWWNEQSAEYQKERPLEDFLKQIDIPDEVRGSYVVYCNKVHNKYKTGKVCHIYRPFLIDADGKTEWAELVIDRNILSIILPVDFMGAARYPVTLDPTIGYTSAGGTGDQSAAMWLSRTSVTMPEAGTATKVYVSIRQAGSERAAYVGYYNDSAGAPHTCLDADNSIPVSGYSQAWYSADVTGELTSGAKYYPACCVTIPSASAQNVIYLDFVANSAWKHTLAADTMPNDPSISNDNTAVSIYAEYTESGGGTIEESGNVDAVSDMTESDKLLYKSSGNIDAATDATEVHELIYELSAIIESAASMAENRTLLLSLAFELDTVADVLAQYEDHLHVSGTIDAAGSSLASYQLLQKQTATINATGSVTLSSIVIMMNAVINVLSSMVARQEVTGVTYDFLTAAIRNMSALTAELENISTLNGEIENTSRLTAIINK